MCCFQLRLWKWSKRNASHSAGGGGLSSFSAQSSSGHPGDLEIFKTAPQHHPFKPPAVVKVYQHVIRFVLIKFVTLENIIKMQRDGIK